MAVTDWEEATRDGSGNPAFRRYCGCGRCDQHSTNSYWSLWTGLMNDDRERIHSDTDEMPFQEFITVQEWVKHCPECGDVLPREGGDADV